MRELWENEMIDKINLKDLILKDEVFLKLEFLWKYH